LPHVRHVLTMPSVVSVFVVYTSVHRLHLPPSPTRPPPDLIAAVLALALYLFVMGTMTGRAARAIAQNRYAAPLMGINVFRVQAISYAVFCLKKKKNPSVPRITLAVSQPMANIRPSSSTFRA